METRTPMPAEPGPAAFDAAPLHTIIRLMNGAWIQQALYVAAKLDVADLLAGGPLPVEDLAEAAGAHTEALYRYLRALTSVGVFTEPRPRTFSLNPVAECLLTHHPHSHKWIVIQHGEEAYQAFGESLYTARTGLPAFDKIFGKPIFDWWGEHPERRSEVNKAIATSTDVPLVASEIDPRGAAMIVDVAGGQGRLLGRLLRQAPAAAGVLYDLPEAVRDAPPILDEYGVRDRITITIGDMFSSVPAGGDLYTLCRCLHDFADDQVTQVLRNIRAAAQPGARLAILDALMPETPGYNPAKIADLIMMTLHGGRFYTRAEMVAMLTKCRFEVTEVHSAPGGADPRAESLILAVAR